MDNKIIINMLSETTEIINKYSNEKKRKGEQFNLLSVSTVNRMERYMCRILAELINPYGTHGQDSLFLKSFAKDVLALEMTEFELENTNVYLEFATDKGRSIDIAISTPYKFIPIEVKIYAKDQEKQCSDYYDFAKTLNKKSVSQVYYLTLDGHLPRNAEGLTAVKRNGEIVGYEEVVQISFNYDICNWLDKCIEQTKDKLMLNFSLVQFKNAIESLGEGVNRELNEKIADTISKDAESMKSALAISSSINAAKEKFILNLFERFEREISLADLDLERLKNKFDYTYNNYEAVYNYYGHKKKKEITLVYKFKTIDEIKKYDEFLLMEISVNGTIYFGFVIAENGENPQELAVSETVIREKLNISYGFRTEDWWFYWEYIPEDSDYYLQSNPDFRECNAAYLDLFDDEKLDIFVSRCIERIKIVITEMDKK